MIGGRDFKHPISPSLLLAKTDLIELGCEGQVSRRSRWEVDRGIAVDALVE